MDKIFAQMSFIITACLQTKVEQIKHAEKVCLYVLKYRWLAEGCVGMAIAMT